jgi:hypothetical protein
MTPKIGQLLNRTVLVSIPALFSDGACRPYKLLGFELHGLWLQSEDLNRRLLTDETHDFAATAPIVFVPFAQIAGVMVPTVLTAPLPPGAPQAPAKDKPTTKQGRRPAGQRRRQAGEKDKSQPPRT